MPHTLPSITKPSARFTIHSSLKQVFVRHNPGVHWLILGLFIASVPSIFFMSLFSVVPVSYVIMTILAPLVYLTLVVISGKRRRIVLDDTGIHVQWLFGEFHYPYENIHKIMLIKNLTYVNGQPSRRHNGMALLVAPTQGFIPGFAGIELGHQAYIDPKDLEAVFNAFDEKDRVQFDELTRAQMSDWFIALEKQRVGDEPTSK